MVVTLGLENRETTAILEMETISKSQLVIMVVAALAPSLSLRNSAKKLPSIPSDRDMGSAHDEENSKILHSEVDTSQSK